MFCGVCLFGVIWETKVFNKSSNFSPTFVMDLKCSILEYFR